MDKNKIFFFITLFLVIFFSNFSIAQINSSLDQNQLTELNKISVVAANPKNWGQLLESWKEKLLQNEFISHVNSFLISINPVFLILFGTDYSLSLFMFFVIFLWIFFLIEFNHILNLSSIFSKWISLIVSCGFTILLSQAGLYPAVSTFLVNLIHKPEKTWLGILILIGIIILFVFIANINRMVEKKILKNREEVEKEEEKNNRKILDTYVEGISKGFKE